MDLSKIQGLAEQAGVLEDQSQEQTFTTRLIPEGNALALFIGYIELGDQFKKGNAKFKSEDRYVPQVRLIFELTGKDNEYEIEVDGVKKTVYDRISFTVTKGFNSKGDFKKISNAMAWGREIKHLSALLGESFILTVVHGKSADNKKTYVNLRQDFDSPWLIGAPAVTDPVTKKVTRYKAPAGSGEYKLFLWNMPNQEMWDDLFIDGEKESAIYEESVNEKGEKSFTKTDKTEMKSKNYWQELLLSADNLAGSPLDLMLGGVADLPTDEEPLAAGELPSGDLSPEDLPFDPDPEPEGELATEVEEAIELGKTVEPTKEPDLSAIGL